VEEIPSVRPQLPAGVSNYITEEGAERLRKRLDELLEKKRSWATNRHEGGTALDVDHRRMESAIRTVQQILDSVIIAAIPADTEKVAFGAKVTLRHENGVEEAYKIVGVEEADPEAGGISWISPLARALLGRKASDKVRFLSPAGSEELTILSVHYGKV
jgi:transcription elongation factor GreB